MCTHEEYRINKNINTGKNNCKVIRFTVRSGFGKTRNIALNRKNKLTKNKKKEEILEYYENIDFKNKKKILLCKFSDRCSKNFTCSYCHNEEEQNKSGNLIFYDYIENNHKKFVSKYLSKYIKLCKEEFIDKNLINSIEPSKFINTILKIGESIHKKWITTYLSEYIKKRVYCHRHCRYLMGKEKFICTGGINCLYGNHKMDYKVYSEFDYFERGIDFNKSEFIKIVKILIYRNIEKWININKDINQIKTLSLDTKEKYKLINNIDIIKKKINEYYSLIIINNNNSNLESDEVFPEIFYEGIFINKNILEIVIDKFKLKKNSENRILAINKLQNIYEKILNNISKEKLRKGFLNLKKNITTINLNKNETKKIKISYKKNLSKLSDLDIDKINNETSNAIKHLMFENKNEHVNDLEKDINDLNLRSPASPETYNWILRFKGPTPEVNDEIRKMHINKEIIDSLKFPLVQVNNYLTIDKMNSYKDNDLIDNFINNLKDSSTESISTYDL